MWELSAALEAPDRGPRQAGLFANGRETKESERGCRADPTRVVQTGEQRSRGIELGASGSVTAAWQVAGGVSWQKAEIMSATSAARAGARVPLVPSH